MHPVSPEIPPEIARSGNRFSAWLGSCVLRGLGWRITGAIPAEAKMVIIVAPHTSSWDFIVGLAAKLTMRLESVYLAKDSLFRWPLSTLLRRTGGLAVDRSGSHNLVDEMASRFASRDQMILTIAPEGTRSHVDAWKTGFYRIAEAAGVPILPIALDFGGKAIAIGEPLHPAGDMDSEIARLRAFFEPFGARRPEQA